jgi:tape measure domain-containing protein|tara:strand:- start:1087 stop:2781 length:1695 start_codon:yes stop_codon:yes gene_type:complete
VAQSTVRLIVDAQNAIRPLQRTDQITRQLSKNTDKLKGRLDRSNRSFREQGRSAKVAAGGVQTLTRSLAPLLKALAVAATARFIFVKTAELQTQRTALIQLTGSVDSANKIISELQAFGNVTPFTSSELIEQSKRLKAFGFETQDLVDTVKRLSDVAGATGADLSGISTAFGQILAKGKLQREEELQLLERGVDITSELKRITGLQGDEFESAMRKGKIGADLVNQALINLTSEGGVFFGGATKQSQTLNGQVSTLVDNIETLARTIGEVLEPALMTSLKTANKLLGAINRLFSSEFQRQISGFRANLIVPGGTLSDLKKIEDFTKNIQPLGLDTEALDLRISQLQGTKNQIDTLMNQMGGRISLEEINQSLSTQEALTKKINELTARKNLLLDGTDRKVKKIEESTDGVSDAFKKIGDSIAQGVSTALTDAILQAKTLGEAAKGILNMIARQLLQLGINTILAGFGGPFANLPTFANGGRPPVGRPSIVGERGPELFVPSTAGTIIPNHSLGGGVTNNIVVNVDASGSNVEGNESQSRELGLVLSTAIQAQLIQEKRPGGLLA